MSNKKFGVLRQTFGYTNTLDAYVPELWAMATLELLFENMVIGNLVHRDFSDEVRNFGDVVNTRKRGKYTAQRKTTTEVTSSDSDATNVAVSLNHHAYTTLEIKDTEMSYAFKDLVSEFLQPAVMSLVKYVDLMLIARMYSFIDSHSIGTLGGLTSSNAKNKILDVRTANNIALQPVSGRHILWGPTSEGLILQNDAFTQAYAVGDNGTAFEQAKIGRKLGYDHWMCQNMPEVATGSTTGAGAVNNASGYSAGATSMTVDGAGSTTTNIAIGSWFTINGYVHQVATLTGSPSVTAVTFTPALHAAVADNDVITWYKPGAINNASGYTVGTLAAAGALTVDGFSVAPKAGQLLTIGSYGGPRYMVISATTTSITLDRPLDASVADDAVVGLGPAGNFNFEFDRNAICLVSRPLAVVPAGMGVFSGVAQNRGLGMRVTRAYDPRAQTHLLTLDMLVGSQVLDIDRGAIVSA